IRWPSRCARASSTRKARRRRSTTRNTICTSSCVSSARSRESNSASKREHAPCHIVTADARLTPYELILEPLEQDAFPAIRAEAEQRGRDALQHDDFLLLGLVGATLSSMIADDAPAEAVDQYGELFWQGYRFWSAGRRFYTFGEAITSTLIAKPYDMDGWQLAAPPSCYVQFPNQRLWTRVAPDAPFEPVDGCFIASDESSTDAGARVDLRVLLV